jgi:ribose 1,5-bisphosphokinase
VSATGIFIAVVGPSGAGKDTILAHLKTVLPAADFAYPPRIISRPPDASEASRFLAAAAFPAARARGEFLIDWQAHGLFYAIPDSARQDLEQGRHVLVNLSRAALPALRATGLPVLVVHVTARADILEQRLRARGRELDAEQQARLARGAVLDHAVEADIRIENNDTIEAAVHLLTAALMPLTTRKRLSA